MSAEYPPALPRRRAGWLAMVLAAALGWFGNECYHQSWDAVQAASAIMMQIEGFARFAAEEITQRCRGVAMPPEQDRVKANVGRVESSTARLLPAAAQQEVEKGDDAMAAALALMAEVERTEQPLLRQRRLRDAEIKLEAARQHFERAAALAPADDAVARKFQEATRLFHACRQRRGS